MKSNLLLLALFFLAACAGKKSDPKFEALLAAFKENPSAELAERVFKTVDSTIQSHPENHELNARMRGQFAEALVEVGQAGEAVKQLSLALKNDWESKMSAQNALMMATIYESKLGKPTQASVIRQGLQKTFPNDKEVQAAASKLEPNLPPLADRIRDFGKRIFNDSTQQIDPQIAAEFISAAENYALVSVQDTLAPRFLIDAATIARNLSAIPKVLELFQWVYTRYPEHPKAAEARFLEGFTYDSDLGDLDKARTAYETFLQRYPDHEFADDARVLLNNLGKSDEEILKNLGTNVN